MKKILLMIPVAFIITLACGQNITQVSLSNTSTTTNFYFLLDGNTLVNISQDGNIIEWGTAMQQGRMAYYPGKLEPFIGKVEYYGSTSNDAFRGKPKYIGSAAITYYASYENENFTGKVKSIGSVALDYYAPFDNDAFKGKLKTAGTVAIGYYASYENESLRSKLKSIGGTGISYYSSYDDKAFKGKLKAIGSFSYTYFSSFEQKEYRGGMKTGNYMQLVNGINYILK